MTHHDSDNTTAPHTTPELGQADAIISVYAPDLIAELRRGIEMIHDALTDPARPRQSCGEVAAWWLRYADKCVSYVCDDPTAGAKAREANNG